MGELFVACSDWAIHVTFWLCFQLIAEENQARLELKLALDSKDCDIERLRSQITSLSIHSLDTTSIGSGNDLETADGYPGLSSFKGSRISELFTLILHFLPFLFFFLTPCFPSLWFHYFSPFFSADNSRSHLRVSVLHLPAHSQIRLHWHAAQTPLGCLCLWLWRRRRSWWPWGAGPAAFGSHLWTAPWAWTWRWTCMAVHTWDRDGVWHHINKVFFFWIHTKTQLWRVKKLIRFLCWLFLCCALILSNVYWTHSSDFLLNHKVKGGKFVWS